MFASKASTKSPCSLFLLASAIREGLFFSDLPSQGQAVRRSRGQERVCMQKRKQSVSQLYFILFL